MPPSRYVRLTDEEDERLRQIEQDAYLNPKVRLRAQVLRLSARGESAERIASYTARSKASILRDLDRFQQRGFEGLADGSAPGRAPRITQEARAFMREKLTEEDRTWNATQLSEALEERFGIEVTPEAVRQHLLSMGYSWKRTRYVPSKPPDPDQEREAREELEGFKKGRPRERSSEGEIVLKYLDESGFYLCLPPSYTWTLKGQAHQHRVRSRWGSKGRINLIGTLAIEGCAQHLEYRMMEGSCRSVEVASYLNALAEQAHTEGKPCVVVLDNASFHTARMVREREGEWEEKGLVLYRLPAYCPQLNLIEPV